MTRSTQALVNKLLDNIFTTDTLKLVSDSLEELTLNKHFRDHANAIVTDTSLNENQMRTQMNYLIRTIDAPLLYDFFSDIMSTNKFWIFDSSRIDYFDKFVQTFQVSTNAIEVLYVTTSVELTPTKIKTIATDLSKTFEKKVILKHDINPAILGGVMIRLGNLVYDFSLRSKFQQFQRQWLSSIKQTEHRIGRHDLETELVENQAH